MPLSNGLAVNISKPSKEGKNYASKYSKYVTETLKKLLHLPTVVVRCSQLNTLKQLGQFVFHEIIVALMLALIIMSSWMSLYFTNMPPTVAFILTCAVLAYTSRRWYKLDAGETSNQFLLKLRLAKMLFSCTCTLLCLFAFLLVSVHVFKSPGIMDRARYKNMTLLFPSYFSLQIILYKDVFSNLETPILIFLYAIEGVLLTDIFSNVIKMMKVNKDYRIALNFELPIIFVCSSKIALGAWLFNILNSHVKSPKIEAILILLVSVWIIGALIDLGVLQTTNRVPRRNDFYGYRMIQDISWFQVDVDIVAYSISILLYSQWKTAPNLVYPEEISLSSVILTPVSISKSFFHVEEEVLPNSVGFRRNTTIHSEEGGNPFQFTSEGLFLLFMLMITLRFQSNFTDSYKYTRILRTTQWMPQLISAQQRHSIRNSHLRREVLAPWAQDEQHQHLD